jgi:hypothetical protein
VVRRTCAVVAILAVACGKSRDPAGGASGSAAAPAAKDRGMQCELLPFAASTPVPEASAATWIAIERSETGGGDPDGSAGGAGGRAARGIDRNDPVARASTAGAELDDQLAQVVGQGRAQPVLQRRDRGGIERRRELVAVDRRAEPPQRRIRGGEGSHRVARRGPQLTHR